MDQATTAAIREVTEADFPTEVLQASSTRPVVVDFWAPWCGPCHQLSPLLERVAQRHRDEVDVVKLNVDQAQSTAAALGIRGIPTVMAFRDGRVVAQFTGVQPEHAIERFFTALLPSQADRLVAQAEEAADDQQREALLDQALAADPDHAAAVLGKARLLAARGEVDAARTLLDRIPGDPAAKRLAAELSLAAGDVDEEELARLRQAAEGGDAHARLALGRALAAAGRAEEALAELVAAVRVPSTREQARTAVLEVFALLGEDSPIVATWRPKLAAALF